MAGDTVSAATPVIPLIGIAIAIASFIFGGGKYLTGSESDNVMTLVRLGPAGGKFEAVYEAEGCTDKSTIGEDFWDGCMESYDSTKEDEDISCAKFLHRITFIPYVKDGNRIDILDLEIRLGEKLTAARQPLRFWPHKMCTYCDACKDMGNGFLEAPMFFDNELIITTSEFRKGISNTNEIAFSLLHDRKLVFHTGTWSSVWAHNWDEQQRLCNENLNIVELKSGQSHSCRRRRMMSRRLAGEVAVEAGNSNNEHIIVSSKTLFSKTKTVPITFHEKDVVHLGLNKTVDLHVTVYVAPHESRRFLLAEDGAEDRRILQRSCPACVSLLENSFQNITGRLSAQINQ